MLKGGSAIELLIAIAIVSFGILLALSSEIPVLLAQMVSQIQISSPDLNSLLGVVIPALLIGVLSMSRFIVRRVSANYFYAPLKEVKLRKEDLAMFHVSFFLTSRGDALENILRKTVDVLLMEEENAPIWIKLLKEKLGSSYITLEEKRLYEVEMIGEKGTLKKFLQKLAERIKVYKECGMIRDEVSNLPLEKWGNCLVPVKSSITLPKNLRIINGSSFFGKLVVALMIIVVVFIGIIVLISSRRISREIGPGKAAVIATKHLEKTLGIKPKFVDIQDSGETYLVRFEKHFTAIDKRTGEVKEVIEI